MESCALAFNQGVETSTVHHSQTQAGSHHNESEIQEEMQYQAWKHAIDPEFQEISRTVEEMLLQESQYREAEEAGSTMGPQKKGPSSEGPQSRASFSQHFRDKFGEEGRVQVRVLQRFGSFRHAQVKIDGDCISLHGEDITSFVEFPRHANQLLSSSWSSDLRFFVVFVDGYMTMVELVPEAVCEPRIERELNLICHSGVIVALQIAKRRGDFEYDPNLLVELIHRTRQFTKPFLKEPLNLQRFLALQKALGVPFFENPAVSFKGAEAIVDKYFEVRLTTYRNAQFWNHVGLIEAIAFMDFDCALKCFEAGMKVAEDDATEAMLCANWGQVSGEAMVANFDLLGSCTKTTLMRLNRAKMLDPRLIDTEYGLPILLKPWLLYIDDTLECQRRGATTGTNADVEDKVNSGFS